MPFTPSQLGRYARQFVLPEIGVSGQTKLLNARVLVIGAGALGSPALLYLASAGVGTLGIADDDTVQLSTLQRQIIHTTDALDTAKVDSAEQTLHACNPDCTVIKHPYRVTAENITALIRDYDFVIDGTDRFPTKFLINDACVLEKKPFSHAGAVRFGGQLMTYVPGSACLRCLLPEVPEGGETCAQAGILGAVTGVIGSMQALETIKYLTGCGELLTNRVLHFDALTMRMTPLHVPPQESCCLCGTHPTIHSLSDHPDDYMTQLSCTL